MAASRLNKCVFFKTVQIKAGTKIAIGYTVPMANWRTLVTGCLSGALLSAQAADKVDFKRDIRPIFEQNCYGCHGPTQQMGGMRLDRRSSAMLNRGGTVIGASNAEGSRLVVTGRVYSRRMANNHLVAPRAILLQIFQMSSKSCTKKPDQVPPRGPQPRPCWPAEKCS